MPSDDVTHLPEESNHSQLLRVGQSFGQYTVTRLLGRGGMGEVYEVTHSKLGTRHALKLINEAVRGRSTVGQRFEREAQVMAQLKHPNIVHVDDFGETDGLSWLRMELIEGADSGASLLEQMAGGVQLPADQVSTWLEQILRGLSCAHERGAVHRDLKPANVLIDRSGVAKLTDFGLVSLAGDQWLQDQVKLTVAQSIAASTGSGRADSDETRLPGDSGDGSKGSSTQSLLGTFEYMSPEQKRGQVADARSDLYAIGMMAFRMLTGHESLGMEPPSQVVAGLDPAWDAWVIRSLKQRPEDRFQTATEMLAAMPQSRAKPAKDLKQSKPLGSSGTGRSKSRLLPMIFLLLLFVGGASAYYFGVYAPEQARQSELARLELAKSESADAAERARLEAEAERLRTEREKSQLAAEAEAERLRLESEQLTAAREAERLRLANARGGIVIETEPAGAKVTVGSLVYQKLSPVTLKEVKLGEYPVAVSAAGYEDWKGLVTVQEDEFTNPGVVKLVLKTGSVRISSLPSGASVSVGGREVGKTPLTLEKVTAGTEVSYELRLKGYKAVKLSGTVNYQEELPLRASLDEVTGAELGRDWSLDMGGGEEVILKWIEPGAFQMGSTAGDANEKPEHRVTLTKGFHLGATEVTVGQWRAYVESSGYQTEAERGDGMYVYGGSSWKKKAGSSWRNVFATDEQNPVVGISWNDAMSFCKWLTTRERAAGRLAAGYEYTLPTEAQWEYACRAGTTGPYAGDVGSMGWYDKNSGGKTHAVGGKRANAWGLYDMHGNVWEWCSDWYGDYSSGSVTNPTGASSGLFRVLRGGSWGSNASNCRSADRNRNTPGDRNNSLGFRLALTPSLRD